MSKSMDRDKVRARNAQAGIVFGADEEITSQVKGTLGTGVPTDFLFGMDESGAWISFEQQREQSTPTGETTKNNARITIYMSPEVASKFLETLEHERFSSARDKDQQKKPTGDWNPFV